MNKLLNRELYSRLSKNLKELKKYLKAVIFAKGGVESCREPKLLCVMHLTLYFWEIKIDHIEEFWQSIIPFINVPTLTYSDKLRVGLKELDKWLIWAFSALEV